MPGDFIVILDERGIQVSSIQLAEKFQKWMVQGVKRVVFVVGGSYGVSTSVKESADILLAFSKFTFTHQMVRIFMVEQLYRAMTIIKNEKYHHE